LVRELKAIRMVLMGTLGERVKKEGIPLLRLCVDNQSVVHVKNAFVASSKPMMRELRRLKKVLDELGLRLRQSGYHQWRTNSLTHCHVVSHLKTKQ
jgi:hypothetical protein